MKQAYRYEPAASVFESLKSEPSALLIDVRTGAEFNDGHARGARSLPLDRLTADSLRAAAGVGDIDRHKIFLICTSGLRAQQAVDKLLPAGIDKLIVVEGGTSAWDQADLPMVRSSRLPSLEHQTQIAIGGLLLLVLFKGILIHPLFYALIGLIAIGLIVAGVTARCSLTSLMARMPWNRQQDSPA